MISIVHLPVLCNNNNTGTIKNDTYDSDISDRVPLATLGKHPPSVNAATVDRACGCGRCPRYMSRSCAPSTSRMAYDMRVCRRRRSPAVAAAEVVVVGSSSCPIGMQCIRGFVDDVLFFVNSLFSMFCYH